VVAIHGPAEGLVLELLRHRLRRQVEQALRRPDESHGNDEADHFVDGVDAAVEVAPALHTGVVGMPEHRVDDLLGDPASPQLRRADERVFLERRVAVVVEVVQQADDAPEVFIAAHPTRIPPHAGFHRERMLDQVWCLGPLVEQDPGFFACRDHRRLPDYCPGPPSGFSRLITKAPSRDINA